MAWPGILVVALVLQSDGGLGGCGCWDLEELFLGGDLLIVSPTLQRPFCVLRSAAAGGRRCKWLYFV